MPATQSLIEKEILLHRSLRHPNIVRMAEAFEDADRVFLVQEYCAGGELFERIGTAAAVVVMVGLIRAPRA